MYTSGNPSNSPFYDTFYKVPVGNTFPTQHMNVYAVDTADYIWPHVPIVPSLVAMPANSSYFPQRRPNIWYPAVSKPLL